MIRFPVISALVTALIGFAGAVAVTQPSVWPHFSWIMSGVDYVNGVARGIAPFVRGGCQELATARAVASMIMLALGGTVIAVGLTDCLLAVRSIPKGGWTRPVADGPDPSFASFMFERLRRALLFCGLFVSMGVFRYFWLVGGSESQDTATFSCTASSPAWEIASIGVFGFIVLAPPLALLKRIYRFFDRLQRAARSQGPKGRSA